MTRIAIATCALALGAGSTSVAQDQDPASQQRKGYHDRAASTCLLVEMSFEGKAEIVTEMRLVSR